METIWKYPIPRETPFVLSMPANAHILCVQVQGGQPCLWARVNPRAEKIQWGFHIVGTGRPLPETTGRYLGTWQEPPSSPESADPTIYVFHLFEAVV